MGSPEPTSSSRQLSVSAASHLEQTAWTLVPQVFQSLAGHHRPILMEIAQEPNRLFVDAVCRAADNKQAASQCGHWNGGDLSTGAGVKHVLQRIQLECPQTVWFSLPSGAFSPLQRMHNRNEEHEAQLKEKRREAQKVYVGALCVAEYCVQHGVHVVWFWPENSQAWRLPNIQRFQKRHELYVSVSKGCTMNVRAEGGKLARLGYKVMTTHQNLAEALNKPCRCPQGTQHAQLQTERAISRELITKEYANRVAQALLQELSFQAVHLECAGRTSLPDSFGRGETCTCGEVPHVPEVGVCASCVTGRASVPGAVNRQQGHSCMLATAVAAEGNQGSQESGSEVEGVQGVVVGQASVESEDPQNSSLVPSEAQGFLSEDQRLQVEARASELSKQKGFGFEQCEKFLESIPPEMLRGQCGLVGAPRPLYKTFGAFSHGAMYGTTVVSQEFPQTTRYINSFLRHHLGKGSYWSSFTLNVNHQLPPHKDRHNLDTSPSFLVGFGRYKGGGLWVHDSSTPENKGVSIVTPDGHELRGRVLPTRHRLQQFQAQAWHAPLPWEGRRVTLSAYTTRGIKELSASQQQQLQGLGFRLPQVETRDEDQALANEERNQGPQTNPEATRAQEIARVDKKLYLLHSATGHCSTRHMLNALKRRGAPPLVLQRAEQFRCSVCEEKQRVASRHVASLEPLPPKWCTVSADIGHFQHPETHEHMQFLLILDEGSRFRTARILTKGQKQQPTALLCLRYFQEGWAQYFGHPRVLRLDPAGSFRSQLVTEYCDKHGIYLDIVPGEAHWKIGACEQAIQGVKEVLKKLCAAEPDISLEEALATTIRTFNQRDVIRGFSPYQHALGREPDETGRVIESLQGFPPELLVENATGEFERAARLRAEAEKGHSDWQAKQRLTRAANSRHKPRLDFEPGELVFFWRTQESGKHKRHPGAKQGRFLGPARVLAVESKREPNGLLKAGSAVWLVRGRSLLKCCVEQLRRASPREELLEAVAEPTARVPWTFTKVAEQIGGNQFEDLSTEVPTPEEWHRAQDVEQELPATRTRISRKRPGPLPEDPSGDSEMPEAGQEPATSSRGPRARRVGSQPEQAFAAAPPWWCTVREEAWTAEEVSFWSDETAAVELSVDMPTSQRGWKQATDNLAGYFVGALKRRAVELSERRMSPAEKEQFREAKSIEVRNFVAAKAFEALPPDVRPSRDQAVGMRWILTWKVREDGSKKAKARAVLLGYQDPAYEHRATTAPVTTRQTRQFQLHLSAQRGWHLQKGDVSGAFLQGREYPSDMYCVPCDEICSALELPSGSVTRLRRACYGLVDAPLEWYRTVSSYLESLGLQRLWSDSCAWVWRKGGKLRGMVSGHVDDFMFSGRQDDAEWQKILKSIQERFRWSDWESEHFVQCGVKIDKVADGYELSQPTYLDEVKEINLSASRKKDKEAPVTERERSLLRTQLGALSWHAQQVAPHISAEVSLLLSEVTRATTETVIRANRLLYNTKARGVHKMKIHAFGEDEPLAVFAWVDAGSQNRWDGGSTQGILVGIGPEALFQGSMGKISFLTWHSNKIDRSCRSPGAAEAQAAVNGEDALYYCRYQLAELLYGDINVRDPDEAVRKIPGGVITDSRNVYDKLNTEVMTFKGAEKRTQIELLSVKESQERLGTHIRWVHSEAQLSNALTKAGPCQEMELFYRMGHQWKIVEDPDMKSARKRKSEGLEPLTSPGSVNRDVSKS